MKTDTFLDYLQKLRDWIKGIQDWKSPEGALACLVIVMAVICGLVWLVRHALEQLVNLADSWKKLGLPVNLSPKQKNELRRRQQFCGVLRADLATLAKAENWNDQFFTDLEAEVEAEGAYYATVFDRIIRRQSSGLRRIPSLIQAIESSTEQALLVVGEPGSGKSVALRHLAHQLADRAIKSSEITARIPMYLNLKELPLAPPSGPTADFIKNFVLENIRRGDADTADYVREHWVDYRERGIWFFLFDSFDEIPAVLHAPTGSLVIRQHAEAIRQFLMGMSGCRGALASREFKGPDALPWQKFRILPLGPQKQEQLIENSFLPENQKDIVRRHLAADSNALHRNPLFLTLLCRFIKEKAQAPANDHDLLAQHIIRLAGRDPEHTKRNYHLTPTDLLEGAARLAVLFAKAPELSLAPTQDEIAKTLSQESIPGGDLENLLAALVDVKIGRSDVREAKAGDRRFTFGHRRYQEALFVEHLTKNPDYLQPRELLSDLRWREYTVTLLQSQAAEVIHPILEEATLLLAEYTNRQRTVQILEEFGGHLGYYTWKEDPGVTLIKTLQEGLARRMADVPIALSSRLLNKRVIFAARLF